MWLLDTTTYGLYRVNDPLVIPPYAVLSHCWADNEIAFDDIRDPSSSSKKAGFLKLQWACSEARESGLRMLWVDRLCIDRRSSVELAEAINAMFRWYQNARICYVLLGDLEAKKENLPDLSLHLENCEWFTRSWMLQELLASRALCFYDAGWNHIGTKATLLPTLSSITKIDQAALEDSKCISDFSIGRRMAWASRLSATRPEDIAYSLLGIFGVSMTVTYGEGWRAFLRLQEEILKDTNDATIFAWQATDGQKFRGLLAHSPGEFSHFITWRPTAALRIGGYMQISSAGIIVEDVLGSHGNNSSKILCLAAAGTTEDTSAGCGILVQEWKGRFVRCVPHVLLTLYELPKGTARKTCFIRDVNSWTSSIIAKSLPPAREEQNHLAEFQSSPSIPERDMEGNLSAKTFLSRMGPFDTEASGRHGPYIFTKDSSSGVINVIMSIGEKFVLLGRLIPVAAVSAGDSEERNPPLASSNQEQSRDPSASNEHISDYDSASGDSNFEELDIFEMPPKQIPRLDPSHRFTEFTAEISNSGLNRFAEWILYRQRTDETAKREETPSGTRKRLGSAFFEQFLDPECRKDTENEGTVYSQIRKTSDRHFACPFYIKEPAENRACLTRASLRSTRDVITHMWASHRRAEHCPVCQEVFTSTAACDSHVRARNCSLRDEPVHKGVTYYQMRQLCQKSDSYKAPQDKWYQFWDILFPDVERPSLPDLPGNVDSLSCAVLHYWSLEGPKFVWEFLRSKGFPGSELREDERNLAIFQATILDEIVALLLRIFEQETDNTQNPIEVRHRLGVLQHGDNVDKLLDTAVNLNNHPRPG